MTNAFSNFLSQEKQSTEGFNNNQTERYQPKHKTIRLDKNNPEIFVRILPGIKTQENPDGVKFSSKYRSIFLNYNKSDGTPAKPTPFTMPFEMGTSVLDSFISKWKNENIKINAYNTNPAQRYLINVIPLVSNGGQFQYQVDQTGNLFVAPMELTKTLYEDLIVKLQDEHLMPTQDSNLNFISENHAFAVKLYRTGQGTDTEYKVEVYQRQDLGELPQGWENLASDIEKMAEPTEEQSPGFVNYVINSISGTDKSVKNFEFEDDSNTAPQQSAPVQPEPTQGQIDNMMPSNVGAQGQSAPVQQGQPNFNTHQSQPNQNNIDWNNLAQQQSQPEQSNPNPFNNFDTSQVDDSQVPFSTQPENTQSQQQEQPNIPQQQQEQAKPQSVDSILGNLGL